MKNKFKEYNSNQLAQLNSHLDNHLLVNANWAIPMLTYIFIGDVPDNMVNDMPFNRRDAEEFYNYGKKNKDGKYDDDHCQPEFFECWIVTPTMGNMLRKQGEFVIDAGRSGNFWFRQATGQSISMDSVVQEALRPWLK